MHVAPTDSPVNVTSIVISSSKIQLSWVPPVLQHQNGVIQSYTISVYEMDTNATTVLQQDYLHNSIIVTDLHPYYNYELSVAAFTVALGPFAAVVAQTHEAGICKINYLLR